MLAVAVRCSHFDDATEGRGEGRENLAEVESDPLLGNLFEVWLDAVHFYDPRLHVWKHNSVALKHEDQLYFAAELAWRLDKGVKVYS